ncbi:MAG: tetratricopeptide repeat protein [Cellvibrionaceae bacterium]
MGSDVLSTIQAICAKGYQHYSQKDYEAALRLFYQAWLKVPKPQNEHPAAATILSGIGDTYYRLGKYDPAIEALRSALACPDTDEQSLILMRLGQSLINAGQELQGKIYLHRAYRLCGDQAFKDEHPKYREVIDDIVI